LDRSGKYFLSLVGPVSNIFIDPSCFPCFISSGIPFRISIEFWMDFDRAPINISLIASAASHRTAFISHESVIVDISADPDICFFL
jgi:hypothetical protein